MSENMPPQQNGSGAKNDASSVHDTRPGAAHQQGGDHPAGTPAPSTEASGPPAPGPEPVAPAAPAPQPAPGAAAASYPPGAPTAGQQYPSSGPTGHQYPPPPVQPTPQAQQQGGVRSAATGHTYPQAVRPGGFAPSPAQYGTMAAGHAPPQNTTGELEQVWWSGQPESNRWIFNWVAYAAGGLMMLILIGIIMYNTGTSATLAGFLLALVPLTIVLAGVVWLDRWEPEPKSLLLVALLWGAGVSTLTSYWLNTAVVIRIFEATGDPEQATVMGAVVVAPVVEEITKGLGILLIFLVRREHFDGPVDGVVYAATVGAGFAFTENILYFARSEDVVWLVFVMRGLASPFAHALFSACVGIALGLAARRSTAVAVGLAFPAGLVAAMGLHALWNGSASLGNTFLLLYFVVQVPLFIATIVLMVWLRRQESDVVRARLSEYAHAGWFAWHEVDMLASLRTRSQARQWAGTFGESAKQAMKAFQRDATQLAYLRQHVLTGRGLKRAHRSEHEILNQLQQDRHTFVSRAQR